MHHLALQWAQLIGILLAGLGIYINTRSNARSQDVQITLSVIDSFSRKWEEEWRKSSRQAIKHLREHPDTPLPEELNDSVYDILNYTDAIGRLMKDGHLRQLKTIILTIGPRVRTLISLMKPELRKHIEKFGEEIWGGLTYLEEAERRIPAQRIGA